jgi:hypothetical protein
MRKLRKDRAFKWLKNSAGELRLEVSRRRRDLSPHEQSGNSEKHQNIEASEFGKSGISWTKGWKIHSGNPDELRVIHLLGEVAGTRSHRYIRGLEVKSSRPFDSHNSEGIIDVDLR